MINKNFALSVLVFGLFSPLNIYAGPGHDHGDEAVEQTLGDGPKRQATGEVFLPKPAQRQLGIRTLKTEIKPQAKVMELTGPMVGATPEGMDSSMLESRSETICRAR